MIKLVATDLDGTLLRDDKSYSPEFFDIFKKLQEKEIKFVIATGNQYELIRERFNQIQDDLIYLCENGTKIVYQNKILHIDTLNKKDTVFIIKQLKKFPELMIVASGTKHAYVLKRYQNKESFLRKFNRNYCYIDSYDQIKDEILKFSMADFSCQPQFYVDQIKETLPPHLQIVTTGNEWFDIFNGHINKGTGIQFLQDYFAITKQECMAFGDQMNDYDLLLNCEESYAMANACQELKEIAKHIAKSNEEDGVINILKTLI